MLEEDGYLLLKGIPFQVPQAAPVMLSQILNDLYGYTELASD